MKTLAGWNNWFKVLTQVNFKSTKPNWLTVAWRLFISGYWGEYLIEYARLAYDFNAPDILQEAESKLLMAKEKGRGFYSHPYLSLAKLALKTGDKQKCLAILQECKKVFTTEYAEYDFESVLRDEDFREVWAEIGH